MENKTLSLLPKVVSAVVIVIGLLLTIMVFAGEGQDSETLVDFHAEKSITGYIVLNETLVIIGALLMLVFAIVHMVSNIKEAKSTLAGIGMFISIMGISYAMADSTVLESWIDPTDLDGNPTANDAKMAGMWLIATVILVSAATATWIYNEISRAIK